MYVQLEFHTQEVLLKARSIFIYLRNLLSIERNSKFTMLRGNTVLNNHIDHVVALSHYVISSEHNTTIKIIQKHLILMLLLICSSHVKDNQVRPPQKPKVPDMKVIIQYKKTNPHQSVMCIGPQTYISYLSFSSWCSFLSCSVCFSCSMVILSMSVWAFTSSCLKTKTSSAPGLKIQSKSCKSEWKHDNCFLQYFQYSKKGHINVEKMSKNIHNC